MFEIAVYIVAALVMWFLWLVTHEMSHIMAAFLVGDVKDWSIKPYPNRAADGHWRFASASWTWEGEAPSQKKQGFVSLAPRIPNLLAIALIPVTLLLTGIPQMLLLIFCLEGVIGLIVGSIGKTPNSDLQKGARRLDISPWAIRLPGLMVAIMGVLACLLIFLSTL